MAVDDGGGFIKKDFCGWLVVECEIDAGDFNGGKQMSVPRFWRIDRIGEILKKHESFLSGRSLSCST